MAETTPKADTIGLSPSPSLSNTEFGDLPMLEPQTVAGPTSLMPDVVQPVADPRSLASQAPSGMLNVSNMPDAAAVAEAPAGMGAPRPSMASQSPGLLPAMAQQRPPAAGNVKWWVIGLVLFIIVIMAVAMFYRQQGVASVMSDLQKAQQGNSEAIKKLIEGMHKHMSSDGIEQQQSNQMQKQDPIPVQSAPRAREDVLGDLTGWSLESAQLFTPF